VFPLNRVRYIGIQAVVTGKGLLKRIGMTIALTAGLFVFLSAIDADATPIRPNIRKLVSQSQSAPPSMAPARAGWDGPEMPRRTARTDPAFDPAVTLRANKAALITAAIPDPRAVIAVVIIIFLMRLLLHVQEKQKQRPAEITPLERQERLAA
jgi:hypothetical protein